MTESADRESPSPSRTGRANGEALLHSTLALPWLTPAASSLALMACSPEQAWPTLRFDPGAVLLLLRGAKTSSSLTFVDTICSSALPLEQALKQLESKTSFLDWHSGQARPVYDGCLTLARLARWIARRSGRCDPEQAWCAGLLSPLGWLALTTIAPGQVASVLLDASFSRDPVTASTRQFGFSPTTVSRRLARQWQLPTWLQGLLTHLELPLEHARRFGVDPALFALIRLAIQVARSRGVDFGLFTPATLHDEESALGLRLIDLEQSEPERVESVPLHWTDPAHQPLLRELLSLALENRKLRDYPRLSQLEHELDHLHAVLSEQIRGESERLQAAKLSGLAEFAAGASHEINNPLAVISGQAQYILGHETDWLASDVEGSAKEALRTIIYQTKRIHTILRDVMQFARPAPARPSWFDLPTLLGEVAASLEDLAVQRQVKVEVFAKPERVSVLADLEQVRSALSCLLRNAIEAVPPDGWARLALIEPGPTDRIEVFIEDSGPGPSAEQRAHLFDPFFSGRHAGRGRGLGLPLAWRLARQQGGDVHLEPVRSHQPTRFVLSLPRHVAPVGAHAA